MCSFANLQKLVTKIHSETHYVVEDTMEARLSPPPVSRFKIVKFDASYRGFQGRFTTNGKAAPNLWICLAIRMADFNIRKNPYFKAHGLPDVIAMNYLNLLLQDSLIVTKHVQQAALIEIPTCEIKATSIGFKLDGDDVQYFLSAFKNPLQIRENGLTFEDKNYRCVRAEKQSVYAKLGQRGLVLVKTKTMLIVATFSESMLGSVCVETVEKMADYFRKKDM